MSDDARPINRLHGIWLPPRFLIWGERAAEPNGISSADVDGKGASRQSVEVMNTAVAHPFAMNGAELHATLGELIPDSLLASIADESELNLWLPAIDGCPSHSTAAGTGAERTVSRESLRTFRMTALSFGAADMVDLLMGLPDSREAGIGGTIRYWHTLARFAMSLLARRQFSPTVDSRAAANFAGRWTIFVTDQDELAWLEQLVHAMPAACHPAISTDAPSPSPAQLVDAFLGAASEAIIRRSLESDEFYQQFHDRATSETKWEIAWISSLIGDPRSYRWPDVEGEEIASQIRAWATQTETRSDAPPLELRFTLLEPDLTDSNDADRNTAEIAWRVRFDLRVPGSDERLDIAKVWRERVAGASTLARHLATRGDWLHAELSRAATVFPALRSALSDAEPCEVILNTEGAHAFIREHTPLLVTEGYDVQLPDWAGARQRRLGLELVVRPPDERPQERELSLGSFGLGAMLDFDWRVAVGDERLTSAEFESITASRAPLVRLRGQWVDVDQAAIDRATEFMRQHAGGAISLAQAIRLAAGVEEQNTGLPIVGIAGQSWLERLFSDTPETRVERLEQPSDFAGTMRPYQVRGLEWLWFLDRIGIGGCLADDMGLGKTIQLIALLLHERRRNPAVGPTLLFVPMSVVGNWQREIQRFAKSLRVLVHHGPDRLSEDAFVEAVGHHDIVITTYGLAHRDLKSLLRIPWHRITLDEAQKIKNPSANQTLAIRSLPASHRVALTGTPLENHLSELWSIMEALNSGLLGSAASFRKQFAVPIEKMGDQQRAEQLRRMIRPFILRRLKGDPQIQCDLPEKMEMRVFCNLTPEQAALYRETVRQMLDEIDRASGIRRRGLILATLTKLKQVCNHPAHYLGDESALDGRSGKCERIVEMLEEVIDEGDAALVFTQYRVMGDLLKSLFQERLRTPVLFLHGATTAKDRDRLVDSFQNPQGDARIFLLSLKAGGFGLNLTRANHVFHFDRWWNPAVEQQATDRAHRIGQTRRVQVYKFVCIGTIEDRIDRLLTEKSALADNIVGSGDEWLTGLSTHELKEYLTLSADAVAES